MPATHVLYPNFGGEEGDRWRRSLAIPALRPVIRTWRALFGDAARLATEVEGLVGDDTALHPTSRFDWLDELPGLVPWLSTDEARQRAATSGLDYGGAPPEIVRRVHDKSFVERHQPPLLDGLMTIAAPGPVDDAASIVEETIADWPDWARASFAVKPRWGTSGRGQVRSIDGRLDQRALKAVAEMLSTQGCVIEPWLDRVGDLSVQLYVSRSGDVEVLATLHQLVSASGSYAGNGGVVAADGSIRSGTRWDDQLVAAALDVGTAAAEAGFFGPCGIDAFVFDQCGHQLRPVVELNARFTAATGVLARVRGTGGIGEWTYWVGPDEVVFAND